jgi:hypothetical protein
MADLNREVITKHMDSIVELITGGDLSTITLIVLFNLCNDFGIYLQLPPTTISLTSNRPRKSRRRIPPPRHNHHTLPIHPHHRPRRPRLRRRPPNLDDQQTHRRATQRRHLHLIIPQPPQSSSKLR